MTMTKKRWLPAHVYEYKDRHGKLRYRYAKAGRSHHFKTAPGTPEFMAELAGLTAAPMIEPTTPVAPKSIDDLCLRFYKSTRWTKIAPSTRAVYRNEIERFRNKYGSKSAVAATVADLDKILAKMHATPSAANNLRKRLKMLFKMAVKLGWRTDNPADFTDSYKETGSYHTWTDAEIEQYRAHHPYGSKARLAMELALNVAARRCNVAPLSRDQLIDGCFHIHHAKGNNAVIVPAMPEALAAIRAMPVQGLDVFLLTAHGKPFTVAGLGNAFKDWCREAGLPHCTMHGLRKAQSRRLAESGATSLQGRAVTGHVKDSTFAYYAEKADRAQMAKGAISNLETHILRTGAKDE